MKGIWGLVQAIVTRVVGDLDFREDFEPPQGEAQG